MIRCTGRSADTVKMPNKPIELGFKFHCLANRGYIIDFVPTSNTSKLDPVPSVPGFSPTSNCLYHLTQQVLTLPSLHKIPGSTPLAWNLYVDNYYTNHSLFRKLREDGIGACGTARASSKDFPNALKIPANQWCKSPYHHRAGLVLNGVGVMLWMDNKPITMMSTIHQLRGWSSEIKRLRRRPARSNPSAASQIFGTQARLLQDIPTCINDYNHHKGGVDIADQYRCYYDTQLTSFRTWYPMFFWALDTAIINSFIIFRDLTTSSTPQTLDHKDFRLQAAWALILQGWCEMGKSTAHKTPTPVSKKPKYSPSTTLPPIRHLPGPHLPVHSGSRSDCFLCKWHRKKKGQRNESEGDNPRSRWKCHQCGLNLCLTDKRNCFYDFHLI